MGQEYVSELLGSGRFAPSLGVITEAEANVEAIAHRRGLTRAALSTCGRAKNQIPISIML